MNMKKETYRIECRATKEGFFTLTRIDGSIFEKYDTGGRKIPPSLFQGRLRTHILAFAIETEFAMI